MAWQSPQASQMSRHYYQPQLAPPPDMFHHDLQYLSFYATPASHTYVTEIYMAGDDLKFKQKERGDERANYGLPRRV